MEALLIYDLFIEPFEKMAQRIEVQTANIVSALIKAFFVLAVTRRENLYYGHLKIIVFAIHFFQRNRQWLPELELLCIQSVIFYILIDTEIFLLAYVLTAILFLDSKNNFVMDTILLESFITYCFRYVLSVSDTLVIVSGVTCVVLYYIFQDKQKHLVDLILGALIFLILRSNFNFVPFNDSLLVRLLVLTNVWMLLKSKSFAFSKFPKDLTSAKDINVKLPENDLSINLPEVFKNMNRILDNFLNCFLNFVNQCQSKAKPNLSFYGVNLKNVLSETNINNALPESHIYSNLKNNVLKFEKENTYKELNNNIIEDCKNKKSECNSIRNLIENDLLKNDNECILTSAAECGKGSHRGCTIRGVAESGVDNVAECARSSVIACKISKDIAFDVNNNVSEYSQYSHVPEFNLCSNTPGNNISENNSEITESHSNALFDCSLSFAPQYNSTGIVSDCNKNIASNSNSSIVSDYNSKIVSDCNSKIVSDCNSKIVSDCNSKIVSDCISKIVPDYNSKIVPDCNSKIVPDCNSKIVPDCNSNIVPDCNCRNVSDCDSKIVSDCNCNVAFICSPNIVPDCNPSILSDRSQNVIFDCSFTSHCSPNTETDFNASHVSDCDLNSISQLSQTDLKLVTGMCHNSISRLKRSITSEAEHNIASRVEQSSAPEVEQRTKRSITSEAEHNIASGVEQNSAPGVEQRTESGIEHTENEFDQNPVTGMNLSDVSEFGQNNIVFKSVLRRYVSERHFYVSDYRVNDASQS